MAAMRMCDPMLLPLAAEFGVTTGAASATIWAYALGFGLLQIAYGPIGDRFGKIPVVMAACAACALCSLAAALAPSMALLIFARAAMGAAAAGITTLSMAWIGDQVPYAHRQPTLARLTMATVSGMMVGQWFGGFSAEVLGWRAAFVGLTVLFAVVAMLLWVQCRRAAPSAHPPAPADEAQSLLEVVQRATAVLRLARIQWLLPVVFAEGALTFAPLAFLPSRLMQGFGLSAAHAGSAMLLYGAGGLLYAFFARHWLRWLGERGMAWLGSSLVACGMLLMAWAPTGAAAVAGCIPAGLGFYMFHNTLQTQATQAAPAARGTAVALFACFLVIGQSLGVYFLGLLVDGGWFAQAFTATAAGTVAVALIAARGLAPRLEPQRAAAHAPVTPKSG